MQQLVAVLLSLFCSAQLVDAGQAAKRSSRVRIGALTDSWGPTPGMVGLRDGLQELGYRENKDFVIGVSFTQGNTAALPAAAKGLANREWTSCLRADGTRPRRRRWRPQRSPIIFAGGGDLVGFGLIQSFARPGGNITGVSDLDLELGPKRLDLFKEMIQGLKRVLFPYSSADSYSVFEAKAYRDAARDLKITLVEKVVQTEDVVKAVLSQVRKTDVHGILSPRSVSLNIPGLVLEASSERSIPTMFPNVFFAEQGGLASPATYESGRMAARLVDKVLKGESPAEIPVEVNPKIELVINLKVAKALGITVAPAVLYRANRVIR